MPLSRLIYVSEAQFDPRQGSAVSQLGAILSASNRNNRSADITGALIYVQDWFIQALEGERRALWQTYKRIEDDKRHDACLLIEMGEVRERLFGRWWMALGIRDEATDALFKPYMRHGSLKADAMAVTDILALMTALSSRGLDRAMREPALQR